MWTREQVDKMLTDYKSEYGRYRHLGVEVEVLQSRYDRLHRELISNEAAPQAQVITDMPRGGNRVGSKVEDIAVKIADGWLPPEMKAVKVELDTALAAYNKSKLVVEYVEAWLSGLTERERWIIQHQYINGEYWADVIDDYDRKFDKGLSKDTLKRLRDRALERIYQAADCDRAE